LVNYQVVIYQTIGFSNVMSLVFTGIFGTVSTSAVVTLGFLFDRIGRRGSLFMAYGIMIPGLCVTIGLWSAFESSGSPSMAKGVLVGIYLTCFGFSAVMNTFGPVYGSEILPTNIRAAGLACGYFTINALIIVVVQTAPIAIASISWRYFLVFLVLDCIYVVIVYFYYPETKGKTLEEIAGIFGDKVALTMEEAEKEVEGDGSSGRDSTSNSEKERDLNHLEKA
jgi:MFS family permease